MGRSCVAFVLCIVALLLVATEGGAVECDFCQGIFAVAEAYANSTNLTVVVSRLDHACVKLFGNTSRLFADCERVAADAAAALAKLPDFVASGSPGGSNRVLCAMLLNVCQLPCCSQQKPNDPQQLYVTFGGTAGSDVNSWARVTWVTAINTGAQTDMQWGTSPQSAVSTLSSQCVNGTEVTYTDGGWVGQIHHCWMGPLTAGTRYFYRVGGNTSGWSSLQSFVNPAFSGNNVSSSYPLHVAVIGDMGAGNSSATTMSMLQALIRNQHVDWVMHVGDVAYADGNQIIWDQYGRQISAAFSTSAPYVLVPGNHEIAFNFAAFRHRYPMCMSPQPGEALYWSFDAGRTHFIGLDSESTIDTPLISDDQLAWVTQDLAMASKRKRAGQLDWIVVGMHRPMYCSGGSDQCDKFSEYLRTRLEMLFQTNLVDLVFQAHVHAYERSTPVFQAQVMPPGAAPVYIVNGIAGCKEGNSGDYKTPGPAWRVKGYSRQPGTSQGLFGFGILSLLNSTQMRFQLFTDESTILDDFTISPRTIM